MKYITKRRQETVKLGKKIAGKLKGGEILCLFGEMGSGKTTFVSGLVRYFLPNSRVLSPTFIIVRHYKTKNKKIKNIFHVDLYRLENYKEISGLGIDEFFGDKNSIVAIEWAENLRKFIPEKRIDIKFNIIDKEKRRIDIKNLKIRKSKKI